MQIIDFEKFIREIPYEYQAFDIKRKVWKNLSQSTIIDKIFEDNEEVTLSRSDLFHAAFDLEEFIIKVLMWGYPSKGRGKNVDNLLLPDNFNQFIHKLKLLEEKDNIILLDVYDLVKIKGLGFSTLSKILYFKKWKVESFRAMILDQRVINSLNHGSKFKDPGIEKFKMLSYDKAIGYYEDYLKFISELALRMNVLPDQIEMFLFEFGSNLKELIVDGSMITFKSNP